MIQDGRIKDGFKDFRQKPSETFKTIVGRFRNFHPPLGSVGHLQAFRTEEKY